MTDSIPGIGDTAQSTAKYPLMTLNSSETDKLLSFLVAQTVENLPAVRENWVRPLGHGRSPGEENGNSFQYSCLENSMDRGAWRAIVWGIAESLTQLSD